ncbi:hypothetical protein EXIGLDRAFT_124956 [Exidia glandulosa HHB12029]|uniref:Uncharacterized protein n=1 Tax=Exidia glandulosa HHB12029 TaxID=1314781 RepID=A0A165GBY3_EXIGL|nr:hypothetical protein EXIGLDRAFT_124956 [Exidia glandulosa HHB12029]
MYQRFVSTSDLPETPLLLTRSLVVSLSNVPLRFYHNNETVFASLAPALANITSFTGTTQALGRLVQCIDGLRLRSAYLVDVTGSWRLPILETITPAIDTLSKLHIAYELGSSSLYAMSSSNVEYLIVDVLLGLLRIDGDFDIAQEAAYLTASVPRLRCVLFRPRFQMESTAHCVSAQIIEWAELQRDPRVWIDDTFVPIPHNDDPHSLG